jgi:HK97 gp10 family phage protein|tara:strand:- start:248 stop:697 length:450 start_codon:yes stop_codon:yes gene_type:complete
MEINIKVKGLKKAQDALKNLEKDLEQPFREVILGGAQLIRGEAIKSIQTGPKSGRIYEKYNPRRTHQASAPGQAPASDTGNLVSQIIVRPKNPDEVAVESNALYSSFLEFGTSKMLARPFLFPATERSRPKIVKAVFNRVVKEIQRLVK